jgi:hypothetical protein
LIRKLSKEGFMAHTSILSISIVFKIINSVLLRNCAQNNLADQHSEKHNLKYSEQLVKEQKRTEIVVSFIFLHCCHLNEELKTDKIITAKNIRIFYLFWIERNVVACPISI